MMTCNGRSANRFIAAAVLRTYFTPAESVSLRLFPSSFPKTVFASHKHACIPNNRQPCRDESCCIAVQAPPRQKGQYRTARVLRPLTPAGTLYDALRADLRGLHRSGTAGQSVVNHHRAAFPHTRTSAAEHFMMWRACDGFPYMRAAVSSPSVHNLSSRSPFSRQKLFLIHPGTTMPAAGRQSERSSVLRSAFPLSICARVGRTDARANRTETTSVPHARPKVEPNLTLLFNKGVPLD